jgi:hypothetical protein
LKLNSAYRKPEYTCIAETEFVGWLLSLRLDGWPWTGRLRKPQEMTRKQE